MFVADDLGAWLIGALAEAGRRKLTTLVLGNDQDRALTKAATSAVLLTASELRPGSSERAEELAMVVNQVFSDPLNDALFTGQGTLLEGLQAGIASQLAVLDDASLTGTGRSSADVLGVRTDILVQKLMGHLVRAVVVRGASGGALEPLAAQLNHDATHLQGQQIKGMLAELSEEVREALARLDDSSAIVTPTGVLTDRRLTVGPADNTYSGKQAHQRVRRFRKFQFVDRRYLNSLRNIKSPPFVGRPVTWSDVVNGPSKNTGFIERDAIDRLRTACQRHLLPEIRALESDLPLLVVTGAPGAGKTTVVRRVASDLVMRGDCVVADFGINRRAPRGSELDEIIDDIQYLQEAHGTVLLVLDDPFTDEGGFIPLFEELSSARISNISAIAASPTLLYDRNAWKLDYGVAFENFVLGKPSVNERRAIAAIYGREPDVYAKRKDDLLVLTLEAASGEAVQDIVLRTWRTLNGGSGIDPNAPPRRLPWLVRAYMIVCSLSAFGQVCREDVLRVALDTSGDDFEVSSDLTFALDSLVAREGWHIFVVSKGRKVGDNYISASHGTVARLALSLRPALAFDPVQWLFSADVLKQPGAAESLAYLISARGATDRNDGLILSAELGEVLEQALRTKAIDTGIVASVFEAFPITSVAFSWLARRLENALIERANAAAPDSWVAYMLLESGSPRNSDSTRHRTIDLADTIPVADLSVDIGRARKLIVKAREDSRLRRAIIRKSLNYLSDAERRGSLSAVVGLALAAAPPQELKPYFGFLARHLYRYPHDASLRIATLRVIPFLSSSQMSRARWLLRETEEWLETQPDDVGVRSAWWSGVIALQDDHEIRVAFRKIAKWITSSADRPGGLVLAWMLNPRRGTLSTRMIADIWRTAIGYCKRVEITNVPLEFVNVLPVLYSEIMDRATDNRYEPLLREIYDFIALWYWENSGSIGPELPHTASRA